MKISHLALLLFALPTFAGEITLNCDSRVINEKACTYLLQDSLRKLDCSAGETHCNLHPWGSDFIKSWICKTQSSDCTPSLQTACPTGSTHSFNETIDVCSQAKISTSSFLGVCKHEHASHSITVKSCSEGPTTCAKFGGTPEKCTPVEGFADQWTVSCAFPSLILEEAGMSCSQLQVKCERINSNKGVRASLLSCLPQMKAPGKPQSTGPFDVKGQQKCPV